MLNTKALLAGASLALAAVTAHSADLTGAGATFPAPIYAKWAEAYKAATGNSLNYQAIGSGGGIKQITAKTVDFGASDDPMKGEALDKGGLLQFPAVIGGIVPVVNLEGVAPGQMKLNGKLVADLFRGAIKKWNDPAIAALNPGVEAARERRHRRLPLGLVGHHGGLHRLPGRRLARVQGQGRRGQDGQLAHRCGRQGQCRRGRQRGQDQGRDRLRRVRLRQAEQDDARRDDQQGRQCGAARRLDLRGRRGRRRLVQGAGLRASA